MNYNFKSITEQEIAKVHQDFKDFPWQDKEAYTDFISNMYYFLSHACRLLTSAASRCDLSLDEFHHRFIAHAKEEKNHEKLVLNDLKALNEKLKPYLFSMPPLWQTQYHLIEHKDPLSLLGCISYLENLSLIEETGPHAYKKSLEKFGRKATNYLRVHVEEDGDHIEKLYSVLENLPQHSQENVYHSLMVTSAIYKNFMQELSKKYESKSLKQVA